MEGIISLDGKLQPAPTVTVPPDAPAREICDWHHALVKAEALIFASVGTGFRRILANIDIGNDDDYSWLFWRREQVRTFKERGDEWKVILVTLSIKSSTYKAVERGRHLSTELHPSTIFVGCPTLSEQNESFWAKNSKLDKKN